MFKKIIAVFFMLQASCSYAHDNACHPNIDPNLPQYIVGYGSLMNTQSKHMTDPDAGEGLPVWIKGFKRGWFARSNVPGLNTTFLGIVADPHGEMNAAIYPLPAHDLGKYDQREFIYCRQRVMPAQVRSLTATAVAKGQVWIYVSTPASIKLPNAGFPLVESYVDIFLAGCLQMEKQYHLKGFAAQCITTTHDWSKYWLNDRNGRIYQRYPQHYQPDAVAIDHVLLTQIPAIFQQIKVPE